MNNLTTISLHLKKLQQRWCVFFFIYLSLIHLRFASFGFRTLAGDDIILLGMSNTKGGSLSTFWPSVFDHTFSKWRPVTQLILSPMLDLFSGSFWKYQLTNEVLLASCALAIAYLCCCLADGNYVIGCVAGLFIITTRFNLFHVLQVFGLMESLAILFMLLMLIVLFKFATTKNFVFLWLANLFFFLEIHTHERFIFLLPILLTCSFTFTNGISLGRRVFILLTPIFIVLENFIVKTLFFDMNFFIGGGMTSINSETTNVPVFGARAVLNILGFNSGPDYLSGRNANLLGTRAIVVALIFAVPIVGILFWAAITWLRNFGIKSFTQKTVLILSLLVPLLLSASITFRQEYRWLLSPYVALIVISMSSVGFVCRTAISRGLVALVLLGGALTVDLYYSRHATNTYFFSTQGVADSINDRIFRQYKNLVDSSTFVIITQESSTFNWAVGSGLYYQQYSDGRQYDIREIKTMSDIHSLQGMRQNVFLFDYQWDQLVQIYPVHVTQQVAS